MSFTGGGVAGTPGRCPTAAAAGRSEPAPRFEEDRRRGLVHNAAGYTVTRMSASRVMHRPHLVLAGIGGLTGRR